MYFRTVYTEDGRQKSLNSSCHLSLVKSSSFRHWLVFTSELHCRSHTISYSETTGIPQHRRAVALLSCAQKRLSEPVLWQNWNKTHVLGIQNHLRCGGSKVTPKRKYAKARIRYFLFSVHEWVVGIHHARQGQSQLSDAGDTHAIIWSQLSFIEGRNLWQGIWMGVEFCHKKWQLTSYSSLLWTS